MAATRNAVRCALQPAAATSRFVEAGPSRQLRNISIRAAPSGSSSPARRRCISSDARVSAQVVGGPATNVGGQLGGSNPPMSFPCLDANEQRARRIAQDKQLAWNTKGKQRQQEPESLSIGSSASVADKDAEVDESGPEPAYSKVVSGYKTFHYPEPLELDYGGRLSEFDVAYETWGTLNEAKDNAILLHTGLSASSHAHSTPENASEGWWEKFIGPGKAIDTNRFFVICTNVVGGCYGSTGPSSLDPVDGKAYGTRFPILSIFDMLRAQFLLLDDLGINKLYASVGSSMGGMQSIAAAHLYTDRVGKVVSISGSARSSPSSIALRYAQRSGKLASPSLSEY